jgi:lysophospholipase L1-like esterase
VLGSINDYGFISIIKDELLSHYEYSNITVINGGILNGILDVYNNRFRDLVLYHNPSTVVLMFGDDDILLAVKQRKNLYDTLMPFRVDLNDILMKCNASNLNVILITPTIISDLYEGSHDIDNVLEGMSAIVHEVGQQYNVSATVELRAAMINYLERTNHENTIASVLTFDGIHLNPYGHQFIASQFLYLLGLRDDDMNVLDTTELKKKLQIIPNIKLQHYKNILSDNDSEEDIDRKSVV